jgi:hypothetical protein
LYSLAACNAAWRRRTTPLARKGPGYISESWLISACSVNGLSAGPVYCIDEVQKASVGALGDEKECICAGLLAF